MTSGVCYCDSNGSTDHSTTSSLVSWTMNVIVSVLVELHIWMM